MLVITQFSPAPSVDPFANHFTTYNRTLLQHRVRDLLSAIASVRMPGMETNSSPRVVLCGEGRAGLWALLAAPAADAVIADCAGLDPSDDQAWLAADRFCPGLQSLGGFEAAALLAAPHPLLLHNTSQDLAGGSLSAGYRAIRASRKLLLERAADREQSIPRWLDRL